MAQEQTSDGEDELIGSFKKQLLASDVQDDLTDSLKEQLVSRLVAMGQIKQQLLNTLHDRKESLYKVASLFYKRFFISVICLIDFFWI